MARFDERSYRFETAAQWGAGAMQGFAASGDMLVAEPPLAAARVDLSEGGGLAALGPCDRLVWLRPGSGELVALHDFGAEAQGRLDVHQPTAIHPGPAIVWVRGRDVIQRFSARGLQELGAVEISDVVASASDGADGVWLLVQDADGASLRWLDPHGRSPQPAIKLPLAQAVRALASDPMRRRLVVLDAKDDEREWWLFVIDLAQCHVREPLHFSLPDEDEATPEEKWEELPRWIVVDDNGNFQLTTGRAPGTVLTVSADGIVTARHTLLLGAGVAKAKLKGLIWQHGLIVCTTDGLYRLSPAAADTDSLEQTAAVYITPVLKSPPATPSGWNRAEMMVTLPKGARLTATIVTSASRTIVDRFVAATDPATPAAGRIAAIETVFESYEVEQREQRYKGEGGQQQLHLLLDRIAAPYLWLKLEVTSPAGADPAELHTLRVRYPDRSWCDELPAIYRDTPGSAEQLRQFLAPFEVLYGGIDEAIDRLPSQIRPDTTPDARLSWLLGWLGFPPTAGLPVAVQRELLSKAGDLLARRGTIGALRGMLGIVTRHNLVTIEDAATTRGFWILGAGSPRHAPRLGRDTCVVLGQPGGFRPGTGMRLGEEPLGPFCPDLDRTLRARCGLVTIGIALDPANEAVERPIVESLLAMFVPAHCRIDLRIARAGRTPRGGRLDRGWQLARSATAETDETGRLDDPGGIELGAETMLGAWQLPHSAPRPLTIDGTTALDGARRLA